MGFNSVLKVAADFLRGGCCRGAGLRDRRGLPRGLFLGSGGKTFNGMVGESVTRKARATQGCDPRRIRVQTPRPELKKQEGSMGFVLSLNYRRCVVVVSFASALSVGDVMRSTPKPSPRRKRGAQLAA